MRGDGVQVQRAVGLSAVQRDGDHGDGDVGRGEGLQHNLPPGQVPQPISQPVNGGVQYSPVG